jgi:putative transcriptional regulator
MDPSAPLEPEAADLLPTVAQAEVRQPPERLRRQVLDLAKAPAAPLDRAAYEWMEMGPGLRLAVLEENADGSRPCLVWGRPGAATGRHLHHGDEVTLVLEGRLLDEHGEFGPGEVCRQRPGSVHEQKVAGDADCICYVVYYGDIEPVES